MDLLRLFVYGILKRGYWNHDPFCRGVLEIREARIRGRLYEGPGFPLLKVPDEDILACGTADPLADVATQARLSDQVASSPRPVPAQRVPGAPGALHALRRGPGGTGEGPVRQSPPGGSREAGIQEATDEKLRKAVQTVVRSAPRLRDLQTGGYFCLRLYIIPYRNRHPCGL